MKPFGILIPPLSSNYCLRDLFIFSRWALKVNNEVVSALKTLNTIIFQWMERMEMAYRLRISRISTYVYSIFITMYFDYVYGKLLFNNSINNSNRKYCLDLFFLSFLSETYAHVYRYCVFCIRILEIKLICIYQERISRSIHIGK